MLKKFWGVCESGPFDLLLLYLGWRSGGQKEGGKVLCCIILHSDDRGEQTESIWLGICCSCRLKKLQMSTDMMSLETIYFNVTLIVILVFQLT